LDIYGLIGLNAAHIITGNRFLGHTQRLSVLHVALGLAKIFEREREHELCSISGIYRLATQVPIQDIAALRPFTSAYGVDASGDWARDVAAIFIKQRSVLNRHLRKVYRARNTRIAHLQRDAPTRNLPSIAGFEELLAFGVAFHTFINAAFFNASAHPILEDRKVASSLTQMLRQAGLENVARDFPE
jgi:hypothetical protein